MEQKNYPHNTGALNIVHLISPMVRSFNVCNLLKLNAYDQVNIVKNMQKIISRLYFKNTVKISKI